MSVPSDLTYVGEAPCNSCRHSARCGQRLEACAAFAMFIACDSRWRNAPRAPGRGWFEATLGSERLKPGTVPRGSGAEARLR